MSDTLTTLSIKISASSPDASRPYQDNQGRVRALFSFWPLYAWAPYHQTASNLELTRSCRQCFAYIATAAATVSGSMICAHAGTIAVVPLYVTASLGALLLFSVELDHMELSEAVGRLLREVLEAGFTKFPISWIVEPLRLMLAADTYPIELVFTGRPSDTKFLFRPARRSTTGTSR